jgi:hypothetical protein
MLPSFLTIPLCVMKNTMIALKRAFPSSILWVWPSSSQPAHTNQQILNPPRNQLSDVSMCLQKHLVSQRIGRVFITAAKSAFRMHFAVENWLLLWMF